MQHRWCKKKDTHKNGDKLWPTKFKWVSLMKPKQLRANGWICTDRRLASGAGLRTCICHVFASHKWRCSGRSTVNVHGQKTASTRAGACAETCETEDRWKVPKNSFWTAHLHALLGESACGEQAWQVARVHVAQPVILLYCGWRRRSERVWDSHT